MSTLYDTYASNKTVTVTINSDLLHKAEIYGIDLSQSIEKHLADLVRKKMEQQWLEENREAIDAHNIRVEQYGVFSDRYRAF